MAVVDPRYRRVIAFGGEPSSVTRLSDGNPSGALLAYTTSKGQVGQAGRSNRGPLTKEPWRVKPRWIVSSARRVTRARTKAPAARQLPPRSRPGKRVDTRPAAEGAPPALASAPL